jgi:hypothetical protein
MVKFVRNHSQQHAPKGGGVVQIRVMEVQRLAVHGSVNIEVAQTGALQGTGSTHNAMNLVTAAQKPFRQIGTILTCYAGNQRFGTHDAKKVRK